MTSPSPTFIRLVAAAALAIVAAGCATAPARPTESFVRARAAIEQADRSGAAEYAPLDLAAARDKLARAEAESGGSQAPVRAVRLADEARVDAELAGERARAKKAARAANEVDKSVDALRVEAERPTT